MTDDASAGMEVIWTIPPLVDPGERVVEDEPKRELRQLAKALETDCRAQSVTLELLPGGVSHIDLRFPDRDTAVGALDAARERLRANPNIACRVVATIVSS